MTPQEKLRELVLAVYGSPIWREADANKRMRMVMENIISNRGKFNPERGKHAANAVLSTAPLEYVP